MLEIFSESERNYFRLIKYQKCRLLVLLFSDSIIPYFCHITLDKVTLTFLHSPQNTIKLLLKEEILDKYFTSMKDKRLGIH